MQYKFACLRIPLALSAVIAGSLVLTGCKGGGLSNQEVQQMKSGPPPEMPAEARAAMQRGMQSNSGQPQQAPR